MLAATAFQLSIFIYEVRSFKAQEIVLGFEIIAWLASLSIHQFEFNRAIGHVWYVHPLFWWMSFIKYILQVVFHEPEIIVFEPQLLISLVSMISSLVLGLSTIVCKYDGNFARRNYMKVFDHSRYTLINSSPFSNNELTEYTSENESFISGK